MLGWEQEGKVMLQLPSHPLRPVFRVSELFHSPLYQLRNLKAHEHRLELSLFKSIGFLVVCTKVFDDFMGNYESDHPFRSPLLLFRVNVHLDNLVSVNPKIFPSIQLFEHGISFADVFDLLCFLDQVEVSTVFFVENRLLEALLHSQKLIVLAS